MDKLQTIMLREIRSNLRLFCTLDERFRYLRQRWDIRMQQIPPLIEWFMLELEFTSPAHFH